MTTKLYNTCEYTCICTKRRKFIWWLQNKKKIISKLISQYTCSLNDENQIVIQQARRNRVKNIARHNFEAFFYRSLVKMY